MCCNCENQKNAIAMNPVGDTPFIPENVTLEEMKDRYKDLYESHKELRDRFWKQEDIIHAHKIILKGLI